MECALGGQVATVRGGRINHERAILGERCAGVDRSRVEPRVFFLLLHAFLSANLKVSLSACDTLALIESGSRVIIRAAVFNFPAPGGLASSATRA